MKWWWHVLPEAFFTMDALFGLLMETIKSNKIYDMDDWVSHRKLSFNGGPPPGQADLAPFRVRAEAPGHSKSKCVLFNDKVFEHRPLMFYLGSWFHFCRCLILSAGGTSKQWRQSKIHHFFWIFGQEMTRDSKWILSKIWSGWTARRKSAAVGKHPWAQTSPTQHW